MFQNIFTDHLTTTNWVRTSPMGFHYIHDMVLEIFFDTSNQIEVYRKDERIGTHYISVLKDLEDVLKIIC